MQKGKAEKQRKKTNTENIGKTPDSRERLTIHLTDNQLTDKSLNCREHQECRTSASLFSRLHISLGLLETNHPWLQTDPS